MENLGSHQRSATPVEDRLGALWAAQLEAGAADLPPDIAERLRFSRERALARARLARSAQAQAILQARPIHAEGSAWVLTPGMALAGGGLGSGRPDSDAGSPGLGWAGRLVALLPLAILMLGLLTIQGLIRDWQIDAAAEVDAALLVDDLPPQAYSDPGFAEFLRREGR